MTRPLPPTGEQIREVRNTQGIGLTEAGRKLWEKYTVDCLYWLREQVSAEPDRVAQHFTIYLDLMLEAHEAMRKFRYNGPGD